MLSIKQRIAEELQRDKRTMVLEKIRCQGFRKRGKAQTVCNVGYVLGRYNPSKGTYEYKRDGEGFTPHLLRAKICKQHTSPILNPKCDLVNDGVKGCKYNVSKVFYNVMTNSSDSSREYATEFLVNITLTKPNHYEMLCAVVNNI